MRNYVRDRGVTMSDAPIKPVAVAPTEPATPPTRRPVSPAGAVLWMVRVPWVPEPLVYATSDPDERLHVVDVSDAHTVGAQLVADDGTVRTEALWSRRAL